MLAKMIRSKRRVAVAETRFDRRVDYVCSKASAIALGNLAGAWTDAAFQMNLVAGGNDRIVRPCRHLVLSWGDGENPADRIALGAARVVLREMGWQQHQYVLAVHRDRRNVHVHVVLNRVHPLTGRACSLSHDYARLERACRLVELAFGWPPDRGRFCPVLNDGKLTLQPMPPAHWEARRAARAEGLRPDPPSVRGHERRSGLAPLRDRLPDALMQKAREVIGRARSWPALHDGLLALSLRYLRHGSGARIVETVTGAFMPACHLGTAFGLQRLISRLGRFRPAAPVFPAPLKPPVPGEAAAQAAYAQARIERRQKRAIFDTAQKAEARQLRGKLRGLHPVVAAAFRLVLGEKQRAERQAFRKTPLPRLADHGLVPPALDAPPPAERQRRRHRQLLREARCRKTCPELPQSPMDHTRARQLWERAAWRSRNPEAGAEITEKDDMRRIDGSRLLLARRDLDGALLGYDLLAETSKGARATQISGTDLALGCLGPREASHCIVTSDRATALQLAVRHPDTLVIAAAAILSPRLIHQLRRLIGARPVTVLCEVSDDAGFARQVIQCLPHAAVLRPRPEGDPDPGPAPVDAAAEPASPQATAPVEEGLVVTPDTETVEPAEDGEASGLST